MNGYPDHALMPVRRLIEQASRTFGVPAADIIGPRRHRPIVEARNAVCLVAFTTGRSSPQIGRVLNGRDHSTVLHARDIGARDVERCAEYAAKVAELREFATGPIMAPYRGEAIDAPPQPELVGVLNPRIRKAYTKEAEILTSGELDQESRRRGSIALIAALRVAHPERCAA